MTQLGTLVRRHWVPLVVGGVSVILILSAIGRVWGAGAVGNAATWVEAIGTVGTLAAAVWVASREVANRERSQAARVYYWLYPHVVGDGTAERQSVSEIHLRNRSEAPVYKALLTVIAPDGRLIDTREHSVLAPGDDPPRWDLTTNETSLTCSLQFTDASGLGWSRDGDGILRRYRPSDRRA